MFGRKMSLARSLSIGGAAALASTLLLLAPARHAQAQTAIPFTQAVGGIGINTDGVLVNAEPVIRLQLRDDWRKALSEVPGDLSQPAKLRIVSLRGLQETIAAAQKAGQPIPDAVRYLAGLQRVKYLFVDPERHDLVIAGPADGWTVNNEGEIVGRTSGQPVLHLDDLLVALRDVDAARAGGILCSINPTKEGVLRLQEYDSQQTTAGNIDEKLAEMEKRLGKQTITVGGVPGDCHFAQVMVSADYRMKRLGMNLDPSPVKGLKSYLDMAPAGPRVPMRSPRWWLTASYEPLAKDPEGLAWELRGPGVKCMTEDDYFTSTGQAKGTGQANPAAQRWADAMTKHYDELCKYEAIFAELRNCMDLSIVATIISREHLADRADCRLDLLLDEKKLALTKYNVPKQVDSKAGLVKKGHNYVIGTAGGVQFNPWQLVERRQEDSAAATARADALKTAKSASNWWSN